MPQNVQKGIRAAMRVAVARGGGRSLCIHAGLRVFARTNTNPPARTVTPEIAHSSSAPRTSTGTSTGLHIEHRSHIENRVTKPFPRGRGAWMGVPGIERDCPDPLCSSERPENLPQSIARPCGHFADTASAAFSP